MQIWVDADACPNAIKTILFRAAKRIPVCLSLVANKALRIPQSQYITSVLVRGGPDAADDYIVEEMLSEDLVITGDIPLAARVIEEGGYALSPTGTFYTEDNIRERLSIRDFMVELRNTGVKTPGPAALSQQDRLTFANQLDRFLSKNL